MHGMQKKTEKADEMMMQKYPQNLYSFFLTNFRFLIKMFKIYTFLWYAQFAK